MSAKPPEKMNAANPAAPQLLREELLAEAHRQSEEILQRAKQNAESLLAKAATDAQAWRRQHLAQARAEAERRAQLVLATIPQEADRLRSSHIEAVLESIREASKRRLQTGEGFDFKAALIVLAAEALNHMAGTEFTISVSSTERLGESNQSLAEQIARRAGTVPLTLKLAQEPSFSPGRLLVQDPQHRQSWDNSLLARLERLWPDLRRQIASQAGLLEPHPASGGGP